MQTIVPMLSYEDCPVALEWLCRVFGFTEERDMRFFDETSGRVTHAELSLGDAKIFLATPTPDYQGPRRHAQNCPAAAAWLKCPWVVDGVLVYVDDIDAHFAAAQHGGADLLSGIEEGFPGRRYRAADIEGHRWMFMEK